VQINSITDNLGRVWTYSGYLTFSGMGMAPTVCTYPGNRTWTYTYSGQGRMLTITDPNGNLTVSNTYDSTQTQVVQQTQANGDTWAFTYTTNSSGQKVTTSARTQNGVTEGTDVFVYDPATGNELSHTDPLGATTTFQHDPATGRLLSQTSPLGETTTYLWDAMGNLLSTTDALGNT
jgi:YD repeat-containing protein